MIPFVKKIIQTVLHQHMRKMEQRAITEAMCVRMEPALVRIIIIIIIIIIIVVVVVVIHLLIGSPCILFENSTGSCYCENENQVMIFWTP